MSLARGDTSIASLSLCDKAHGVIAPCRFPHISYKQGSSAERPVVKLFVLGRIVSIAHPCLPRMCAAKSHIEMVKSVAWFLPFVNDSSVHSDVGL